MKLNFSIAGEGTPLILLHGLFGSLENLGALARRLQQDFRVYSLDLPNHGRSPHCDSCDLTAMKNAVLAWMDEEGLAQAALVGHSLGGKVAMELALSSPQRVTKLVVMDIAPVAYDPHHNEIFAALSGLDLSQYSSRKEIDAALQAAIPETAVRSFLLKNLVRGKAEGLHWRMNLEALQKDYPTLIRQNLATASFDGATLFLKGGRSDYLSQDQRADVIARFPKADVKVVADTGHWLHAEKPELIAALITKFLQDNR